MSPELGPHALLARGGQATCTQPPKKPRRCCWLPPLLASRHPATMTCPSSSSRLALLAPGTPRSVSWVRAPQMPPQAPRGHSCQAAWPWKRSQCSLGFCLGDTSREGSAPSTGGLSRGSSSHSSAFGCSSRRPRPRPRSRRPSTCRAGRPPSSAESSAEAGDSLAGHKSVLSAVLDFLLRALPAPHRLGPCGGDVVRSVATSSCSCSFLRLLRHSKVRFL